MKDSFDKDPFAEYDKYWDDLDKQEEKVNRKQEKNYSFDDDEKPAKTMDDKTKYMGIGAVVFIGIFLYLIFNMFSDQSGFTITPFIGIIIFAIIMSTFQNKSKK